MSTKAYSLQKDLEDSADNGERLQARQDQKNKGSAKNASGRQYNLPIWESSAQEVQIHIFHEDTVDESWIDKQ